jgi:hypothetical protein
MSPQLAHDLVLRLDINRKLYRAGREPTTVDMNQTRHLMDASGLWPERTRQHHGWPVPAQRRRPSRATPEVASNTT